MCKIPPTLDVGEDNNNCYELDVINSKDPYAELERYLEKVKAEISEVFAQLESRREENGVVGNDTATLPAAGGSCDGGWSASAVATPAVASPPPPTRTIPRKSAAAAAPVRDSNYNTKASRCQNVACELDSVDGANLEATERLLREIAATLPKQNHHSQQQQQSVSSHQQYSHNDHHHQQQQQHSRERNNGAFESARYCDPTAAFVIGGDHHLQHQQLVLKIDEDHDKPEHHQQRTQQRFNGGRFLTGAGGGLGATDNRLSCISRPLLVS